MIANDSLPDITGRSLQKKSLPLQWVGMEKIGIPLALVLDNDTAQQVNATANIYVSLDETSAKGIHMSRLHAILNQFVGEEFSQASLNRALSEAVASQSGISNGAKIDLVFDLILQKPALLSEEYGYQNYPIAITGKLKDGQFDYSLDITIPYSSTCPCSASLSRQLYAKAIDQQFNTDAIDKQALLEWIQSDKGSVATPHSQRSYAYITMKTGTESWPAISLIIRQFEEVIGTPVQTAVKRMDEQEFARLNANNLMFCEDAARRLKESLDNLTFVQDYQFKVEHQESLHAHNAVVIDQKFAGRGINETQAQQS